MKIAIIGAGPAGIFAAIAAAETNPFADITVYEKTNAPLAKVRISGGGRCNVTHSCFDPKQLILNYPRGEKELLGPFHRYQPSDTIEWFKKHSVLLKTEEDGRMFPTTDNSQTIVDALLLAAAKLKVKLQLKTRILSITYENATFRVALSSEEVHCFDKVILATGSSSFGHELAKSLGHSIIEPVPSLFTFNTPSSSLLSLSGISLSEACLELAHTSFKQKGPLLLTHWGFSGPAALKLSAWAARYLHSQNYCAELFVDWLPSYSLQKLSTLLLEKKKNFPNETLVAILAQFLPKNLVKQLLIDAKMASDKIIAHISQVALSTLCQKLKKDSYKIEGKTTYKQEFVTSGGVALSEIHFKTMESKLCPGLFFAGEVLDIDGVTGGFNFQSCWTCGWIAGNAI